MPGLCPGGKTAAVWADLLPAWARHEKCISSDKSCDSPILPRHIMWLCAQTNNKNPGIFRTFAWLFLNYVLRMTVHFSRKVLWPSNFVTKSLTTVNGHPNVSIHRVICLKICCESSGWTVSVEKSSSAKIDFPPKCSLNSNNLLNSLPIVCLALTFATICNIRTIQHIVWIKEILNL